MLRRGARREPSAAERRNALVNTFAGFLHAGAQPVPGGIRPPQLIAETIVGGVREIVYSRILDGRARALPDLLPGLAYSVMSPYVGREATERAISGVTRAAPG